MRQCKIAVINFAAIALCFIFTADCSAKNLYVSTTGSDSVAYADNDIDHPWLSASKGITSPQPGDTVYFRGGSYSVSAPITTTANINPTSESGRVTFRNYQNEVVNIITTFDGSTTETNAVIMVDRDYYTFDGLNIVAAGPGIFFANTYNARYGIVNNCDIEITVYGGSPNLGCVRFGADRASYGSVTNCVLHGPGVGDFVSTRNTAGVYIFRSHGIVIKNNNIYNIPRGIFYKHTCVGYDTGIEVKNNYIHTVGDGIVWVGQYAEIWNNIVYARNTGLNFGEDGGSGDDGTNIGGDYNNISHNTCVIYTPYNGDSTPILFQKSGSDPAGPIGNTLTNNVFTTRTASFAKYANFDPFSGGGSSDYNLYLNTSACIYHYITSAVLYSLAGWTELFGYDVNSMGGTPVFVDSNFDSITDFGLASGSIGYLSGSDGYSVGVDTGTIGPYPDVVYDAPTLNAGTDQTVYAASAELGGTYTKDPALSVSLCTWEHDNGSGLCVAALGVITGTVTGLVSGANTVTVELTDSQSQIASDTVVFTRQALPKKAEFHGYGSIKNATIHQ